MTSRHYPHLWPQNNIWGKLTVVLLLERDYSLRYLSFPTWIIGSAGFIEIQTVTMDTAISISSSLPAVPLRIVPTSSISLSSSSLLPLPRSHIKNNKFYSVRTRFWNSSSAVPKFTVICGAGITEINQSQFKDTVLKSDRPVLVEFVATWCGPCRLITPAMESIAKVFSLSISNQITSNILSNIPMHAIYKLFYGYYCIYQHY